jgi:hypothetical protein
MTVLFVLFFFGLFLLIDYLKTCHDVRRGTMHTTRGFEALGALAQDGGKPVEPKV